VLEPRQKSAKRKPRKTNIRLIQIFSQKQLVLETNSGRSQRAGNVKFCLFDGSPRVR
jgi:hypothetical protein